MSINIKRAQDFANLIVLQVVVLNLDPNPGVGVMSHEQDSRMGAPVHKVLLHRVHWHAKKLFEGHPASQLTLLPALKLSRGLIRSNSSNKSKSCSWHWNRTLLGASLLLLVRHLLLEAMHLLLLASCYCCKHDSFHPKKEATEGLHLYISSFFYILSWTWARRLILIAILTEGGWCKSASNLLYFSAQQK